MQPMSQIGSLSRTHRTAIGSVIFVLARTPRSSQLWQQRIASRSSTHSARHDALAPSPSDACTGTTAPSFEKAPQRLSYLLRYSGNSHAHLPYILHEQPTVPFIPGTTRSYRQAAALSRLCMV